MDSKGNLVELTSDDRLLVCAMEESTVWNYCIKEYLGIMLQQAEELCLPGASNYTLTHHLLDTEGLRWAGTLSMSDEGDYSVNIVN